MMCGNKTDQCPVCHKYVRRAIFAYHYENKCADPDTGSTNDHDYRKTELPRHSYYHGWQENCLRNPKNIRRTQQHGTNNSFYPDLNQLHTVNNSDYNGALIPCEYCQQGIEWNDYDRHIKLCQEDAHRKLVQKSQRGHWSPITTISNGIQKIKCMFCNIPMFPNSISSHQMYCTKNPRRNNN
ncbi:unnamed protein product [Adineta ricciae]|uniref:Uncharacterized protein n=1 Tax=Adineta ricciae TaxID=249248 RepID=A0A814E328_ADIRI|nr:unnamed protein product [Adineta ricciae]